MSGSVFSRYEKKFLLPQEQYEKLRERLDPHMQEDAYGKYTICNIYYDTPDDLLIRRSLQKPAYKEKLRLRSYGAPGTAREILYIFWAMATGLATGMGFLSLSLMITGGAAIWILLLEKAGFGRQASREKQLRITIPEDLEYEGIFDDLLTGYARKWSLESVRTTNMGTMYELSYRLETDPHSNKNDKELLDALRCRNGNLTIVMGNAQRERNEF